MLLRSIKSTTKTNTNTKNKRTIPSHYSQILKRKERLRYEYKLYCKESLPEMYNLLYLLYEELLESNKYEKERQELLKAMAHYNGETMVTRKEMHNLADLLLRTLKLEI